MLAETGVIYQYCPTFHSHEGDCFVTPTPLTTTVELVSRGFEAIPAMPRPARPSWQRTAGLALLGVSVLGMSLPWAQKVTLETSFYTREARNKINVALNPPPHLPPAAPILFNPLKQPDGSVITPVSEDFSVIVPKIGINSKVIPQVDPFNSAEYTKALRQGVAQAKSSYLPDQPGTMYLFSHSTNYDWYVKDLNAIFYHLKDLSIGDTIVVIYKGKRYTYKVSGSKIVAPADITYLVPNSGNKKLVLQTCYPPGTVYERLLIFADMIEDGEQI